MASPRQQCQLKKPEHQCHARERFVDGKFCYATILCTMRGGTERCHFKLPHTVRWSDAMKLLRAIAAINSSPRSKAWQRCGCTGCQFYAQRALCDCCLTEHTAAIWGTFSEREE